MAVAAHLPLTFDDPAPDLADTAAMGQRLARHMQFYTSQDHIEEALLGAHNPPHQ